MKNHNLLLIAALATITYQVHAQEVISKTTISIYGNDISLPKVKDADGIVCQSYVAETKRDGGELIVKIEKVCGAGIKVSHGLGDVDYYPAGLKSMRTVHQDGQVTHQLPVLDSGN